MGLQDLGLFVGVFVFWIVLNRWILPWFGISTCCCGSCAVDTHRTACEPVPIPADQRPDGEKEDRS